jgi:hypothetical protein
MIKMKLKNILILAFLACVTGFSMSSVSAIPNPAVKYDIIGDINGNYANIAFVDNCIAPYKGSFYADVSDFGELEWVKFKRHYHELQFTKVDDKMLYTGSIEMRVRTTYDFWDKRVLWSPKFTVNAGDNVKLTFKSYSHNILEGVVYVKVEVNGQVITDIE